MSLIKVLHESEKGKLLNHFLSMDKDGSYSRFCQIMNDDAKHSYVNNLDFDRNVVFATFDEEGEIVGVGELSVFGEEAECAFSVLPEARGRGVGHALMDRVVLHAKNIGVKNLNLMCLSDNKPMRRLAEEHGMHLKYLGRDMEGNMVLSPGTENDVIMGTISDVAAEFGHITAESIRKTGELFGSVTQGWFSMLVPWHTPFPVPETKGTPTTRPKP